MKPQKKPGPSRNTKRRNPDEDANAGVKIELDLGGTRDETFTIINPEEFMARNYGHLYLFQFGAYGWTRLLVWSPGSLEEALEEAAEWLAEHAPGHIMLEGSDELQDLYKEAAEELGHSWPLKDEEIEDEETQVEIHNAATADLTYTESGYLTSYEWTVDDVGIHDPIYLAAFEASLKKQRDELDEGEEEKAEELLKRIKQQGPKKNPKRRAPNPPIKAKKLEWNWTWPVMGSHVPSNRHYDADAPLGGISGALHLFPTHDGWKVYWETTEPYVSRMEGEGYVSIGRVPKVAEGKSMAQKWYDATKQPGRSESNPGKNRTKKLAGRVARGGR